MKTNQIMNPESFRVQRTVDGYFNANALLNEWNENNPKNRKEMFKYKEMKSTAQLVEHLKNTGINNPIISSKGVSKGTWMHPLVYVDFAMWISVEFKVMILKWVMDGLIKQRNDAGDYFNEMCATIMDIYIEYKGCKPAPMVFINEANYLKKLVGYDDRNQMSENQLNVLNTLQRLNIKLIKDKVGKVSRYKQLETLRDALI